FALIDHHVVMATECPGRTEARDSGADDSDSHGCFLPAVNPGGSLERAESLQGAVASEVVFDDARWVEPTHRLPGRAPVIRAGLSAGQRSLLNQTREAGTSPPDVSVQIRSGGKGG